MPNDARGRGRELRLNSPTRPTSITVRALIATLVGRIATRTDPHHDCRTDIDQLAQIIAKLRDDTALASRDRLNAWMTGVDAAYSELTDRLEQHATTQTPATAAALRQVAEELNPSRPGDVTDLSVSPVSGYVPASEDCRQRLARRDLERRLRHGSGW